MMDDSLMLSPFGALQIGSSRDSQRQPSLSSSTSSSRSPLLESHGLTWAELYWYFVHHGHSSILVREVTNLLCWTLALVVLTWLGTGRSDPRYGDGGVTMLVVALVVLLVGLWNVLVHIRLVGRCRAFCTSQLHLPDDQLNVCEWADMVDRIAGRSSYLPSPAAVQAIRAELNARHNLLLRLVVDDLDPLDLGAVPHPGPGILAMGHLEVVDPISSIESGPRGMIAAKRGWILSPWTVWLLGWCILDAHGRTRHSPVHEDDLSNSYVQNGTIGLGRTIVLSEEEEQAHSQSIIASRLRWAGLISAVVLPLTCSLLLAHFAFRYAFELYASRDLLGPRTWTTYARIRLRDQAELPHELVGRLEAARKPAQRFLDAYPSHAWLHMARAMAFGLGTTLSLLVLQAVLETDPAIASRWWGYAGVCLSLLALCRSYSASLPPASAPGALASRAEHVVQRTRLMEGKTPTAARDLLALRRDLQSLYRYRTRLLWDEFRALIASPWYLGITLASQVQTIQACLDEIPDTWRTGSAADYP